MRNNLYEKLKGLYVITDETLNHRKHEEIALDALKGGAKIIQLRDKNASDRYFFEKGLLIKAMCKEYNALFIINDRIHIALALDADGVNVGQSDLPYSIVRKILGEDKIIGVSCSNLNEALQAEKDGADYIGLGPVCATTTKLDCSEICGLELIKLVKNNIKTPIASIGGINLNNIKTVGEYGSDMVCVVSGVVCKDNMIEATKELIEQFNN